MILVNGKEIPWRKGMTIQTLLDECGYTFPMIAVLIDGTPYRNDQFEKVCIEDGADVQMLHMISGG